MSYPDYPQQRLIVDGIDLSIRFRMILLDDYTLSPPEPKTYTVDIPGGDGVIDLTTALTGDVVYSNRSQSFTFMVVEPESFERVKTDVSNFLHGKAFDYQMTMDPGYTYHGRFSVTEYSHSMYAYPGLVGAFTVEVDADPYKSKGLQIYQLNATGGRMFRLESGRKPVHPVIECQQPTRIRFGNLSEIIPVGTYRLNDVLFKQGFNDIYINSYSLWNTIWSDLDELGTHPLTWANASKYRWDDLHRLDGDVISVPRTWEELNVSRWSDFSTKKWTDINYRHESAPETNVYISYDWKDL